jgi:prepilin-type N-terminal cleavage/methylation domain-containing protein
MKNGYMREKRRGFTLVEIVVGSAVFLVVAMAIYGAYTSLFQLVHLDQARILAVDLADEQFEIIRNMPYAEIGIVNGVPSGVLPATTTIIRGGTTFNVTYTVRDVDLGIFSSPTDPYPADNKFVQVNIACPTCQNFTPVNISGQVAPKNLENSDNNGALFIQAINADGDPVADAAVSVAYTSTTSPIIINDTTDDTGMLQLVDIPPANQAYNITVTKPGYSTDQTYIASSTNPTPNKPPATVASGQLTQVSFSIDQTSALDFNSMTPACAAAPGFNFMMTGAKTIGPGIPKYAKNLVTDGSGSLSLDPMEWDSYTIAPNDANYDLAGLDPLDPLELDPNSVQDVGLIVVPKDPDSVLVTVKDTGTGLPLSGATVELSGSGYDQTLMTGQGYFDQTDWSHGATQTGIYSDPSAYASGSDVDTSTSTGNVLLADDIVDPYNVNATGTLESSIFDTGTSSNFSTLTWTPGSQSILTGTTSVKFQFATNQSATSTIWNFLGPDGTSNTYYTSPNATISSANNGNEFARYLMYLTTASPTSTPIVSSVGFTYTSSCTPPGQVIFQGLNPGTYTLTVSDAGYTTYATAVTVGSAWQNQQVNLSQ